MCLSELITALFKCVTQAIPSVTRSHGDLRKLCYAHAVVWEFSAFCLWTHSSECVCVCVCAVGPSVAVPCTSRRAGGAPGGQAVCSWQCDVHAGPLREAPCPQAATHCLCLCHHRARLCSGHLHSCNRWFHDAAHPASGGERRSTTCDKLFFGPQLWFIPVQKGTWINWLILWKELI